MSNIQKINDLFGKDAKVTKINSVYWVEHNRWIEEINPLHQNEGSAKKKLIKIAENNPENKVSFTYFNKRTLKSGTETITIKDLNLLKNG